MEKYKKYSITFNEEFFNLLEQKWLNNIEIFLLLNNIEELIKNNFLKLSTSNELTEVFIDTNENFLNKDNINRDANKKKIKYFVVPFSEYGNIPKEEFSKVRHYNIKIKTIDKIKVIHSINENVQRRIYFLLDKPKYIFIHYRNIEIHENNNCNNKLFLEKININTTPINIINFNPDCIEEDKENQKLFIIIKSKFNMKELNNLIPFLSICFGNKFVKCEII